MGVSNLIIRSERRFIIALAWGPRRVPSRYKNNPEVYPYPTYVEASVSLWGKWIKEGLVKWVRLIFLKDTRVQTIVRSAKSIKPNPKKETKPLSIPTLGEEEITNLLAQREQLRKEKNFEEADKIRDKLVSHGIVVSDKPIICKGDEK